jgi:hypothetical protein
VKWSNVLPKYRDALIDDLCERSAAYRRVSLCAEQNHLHQEAIQCKEMADAIDCAVDFLITRPV